MTQEQKELLLKDLCARLPYGVKVKCPSDDEPYTLLSINWNKEIVVIGFEMDRMYVTSKQKLVDIKPYLRPKSSMTEDELQRYHELCDVDEAVGVGSSIEIIAAHDTPKSLDYLNSIHVDYRGLIPGGLAIEVTEDNNPYKDWLNYGLQRKIQSGS